jgi:hypothetical protein
MRSRGHVLRQFHFFLIRPQHWYLPSILEDGSLCLVEQLAYERTVEQHLLEVVDYLLLNASLTFVLIHLELDLHQELLYFVVDLTSVCLEPFVGLALLGPLPVPGEFPVEVCLLQLGEDVLEFSDLVVGNLGLQELVLNSCGVLGQCCQSVPDVTLGVD